MATEYHILLDPALGINAGQLKSAWDETPECAQAGECRVGGAAIAGFPLDLADTATVAVITVGTTLAKDLIMELVKTWLARAGANKPPENPEEIVVEQVPDAQTGLPLIRVSRKR